MQLIEAAEQGNCGERDIMVGSCSVTLKSSKTKAHPYVFAPSVRNLLEKGRGKFRNIFVGQASFGKTFV